jgi:glycosyltransferase involved in cell wall biosynthesis
LDIFHGDWARRTSALQFELSQRQRSDTSKRQRVVTFRPPQQAERRAAVISLHFSPAHASHMIAYGKLLRDLGYAVSFVLDERYISFATFSSVGPEITAKRYFSSGHPHFEVAIICNSATTNPKIVDMLRANDTKVFYVFHEPEPIWNPSLIETEGWIKTIKFMLSTLFSIKTLRRSSGVIVCSSCALSLYERHYQRHNGNVISIPLLFDDEIGEVRLEQMRNQKKSFGFIGTACRAHGFDEFVAFSKYAIRNGSSIPFAIVTAVDLTSILTADRELACLVKDARIQIQHGRKLSNEEINQHYLSSFGVWNIYRRSTQSGVLPRAFMAGSPVVATRVGSFPQFVSEGVTGELVGSATDLAAILDAVERMRSKSAEYVDGCRKAFKDTFYYKAQSNRLGEILKVTV